MAGPAIAAEHLQEDEEQQEDQAETSFTLLTNMDEEGFFFTQEENMTQGGGTEEERNPDLVVPADEEITVTVSNGDAQQHNFCVELEGGEECSDDLVQEGDEAELTFTAPSEGTIEYWCDYHPEEMTGQVRVEAEGEGETGGEEDGIDDPEDPFDPEDPGDVEDGEEGEEDQDTPGFAVVAVLAAFALVAFVGLRNRR